MIEYCAAVLMLDVCVNVLPNTAPDAVRASPAVVRSSREDPARDHFIRAGSGEIVVSLLDRRLFYRDESGSQRSLPVSVGARETPTPTGTFRVVAKKENPVWRPPPTARRRDPDLPAVVASGPDNPLGTHALYLDRPMYLIHGTEASGRIGYANSLGCVRLDNGDIARLYPATATGAQVTISARPFWTLDSGDVMSVRIATFATGKTLAGKAVTFDGRRIPVADLLDTLDLSVEEAKGFAISLRRIDPVF